jgi:hypothetical protein
MQTSKKSSVYHVTCLYKPKRQLGDRMLFRLLSMVYNPSNASNPAEWVMQSYVSYALDDS